MDAELEQRWTTWLTQARNFAARENYLDAVARMQSLCQEARHAVANKPDNVESTRLEQFLLLAERQLADYTEKYDAWNRSIAERRQATIDNAAEEMAEPLPKPPTQP